MTAKQRIGLFGGSFDPPHRGHLRVATAAADAFQLDTVLMAPTGRQPLKRQGADAGFADRLAMMRLLCAGQPRLVPSDIDAPLGDDVPNFTVDTLRRLRERYPEAELFNIVGIDSLLALRSWRDPELLLQLAQWIVVSRPEVPLDRIDELHLTPEQRSRIFVLDNVHDPISATAIRERLRAGVSVGDALPETVALYVARQHLYHAGFGRASIIPSEGS